MARKARTPNPPRRPVQAPQRRTGRPGGGPDRNRRLLLAFSALGFVGLAAVVALFVLTGKSGSDSAGNDAGVKSAMLAAGCTYEDVVIPKPPKGQSTHIPTLESPVNWNTYPPAGGQHYSVWAVWDFYTEAVEPKQVVHNEEHGAVVLWWGPQTPQSEVDKLRAFYDESPNSIVGTPIGTIRGKSLGSKVAITAWTGDPEKYSAPRSTYFGEGHVAVCPKFDESAFAKFRDAYRGKGPEGVPTDANNPGMGPNG